MPHFTPENEELCPERTVEGEGRWEMEEGSVELHLGQMEDRRWKMEATALNPVGKKGEDSRQKREKNNLAGIL